MFTKEMVRRIKVALLPADKTMYMGLLVGTPSEWADNAQEVFYAAYERQPVVFDGVIDYLPTMNTNTATFPVMAANEGLLNVGFYGLYDAATGGDLIEFGRFTENGIPSVEPMSSNRTISFGVGGVPFCVVKNIA